MSIDMHTSRVQLFADLERLHDVIPGTARFTNREVTIGAFADGSNAALPLVRNGRTQNTWIVGGCASGKTVLLESLLAGARHAGIGADLACSWRGDAAETIGGYHRLVLDRARDLVDRHVPEGDFDLRLLLVDDLPQLDADTAGLLADVARISAKTNVSVVVASQEMTAAAPGGARLRDSLKAGNTVQMRVAQALFGFTEIPGRFADGTSTAGVGLVNGDLFRAWYPGN